MMPFSSREEMLKFEHDRDQHYLRYRTSNIFKCAWNFLMDLFNPKYRKTAKMYSEYFGGWWRDKNNVSYSQSVRFIDPSYLHDFNVCVEVSPEGEALRRYVYLDGKFYLIATN